MSEKVALVVNFIAAFLTGFILAYARCWRLALAMSSILPCIALTGAFMNKFVSKYMQSVPFPHLPSSLSQYPSQTFAPIRRRWWYHRRGSHFHRTYRPRLWHTDHLEQSLRLPHQTSSRRRRQISHIPRR